LRDLGLVGAIVQFYVDDLYVFHFLVLHFDADVYFVQFLLPYLWRGVQHAELRQ
jgi:hypothetical protein